MANWAAVLRISTYRASGAALLALLLAPLHAAALTQDAPSPAASQPAPGSLVRCELLLDHGVYAPSERIPARFTLINDSDQPVEIELPAGDGTLGLPARFILGTRENPHLFFAYEGHDLEPAANDVFAAPLDAGGHEVVRLAPGGTLGSEVDLRALDRQFRYSGSFRLEWRPFPGRSEIASVDFRIEPRKHAVLITDYGKVIFKLHYDAAPRNVEHFLDLVRERFYDGLTIHRVVAGYLLQGGSPDGTSGGLRPDGRTVPGEFDATPFDLGTLAMARRPDKPDSASCQFFVSLARVPELDGQYTVIGQASDEESVRLLRQLAELPADAAGRPLRPLVIRFFTLVDVETPRSAALESKPVAAPPAETTAPVPASQADQPGALVPIKPNR